MSNPLHLPDRYRPQGTEAMTPEVALIEGSPPLRDIGDESLPRIQRHTILARLCREYLLDFDMVAAAARAGLQWDDVRGAQRDPLFITMVREMMESLPPEQVVSRTEVLMMLKREATTAPKASERIAAIERLAKLAGLELKDDNSKGGAPTLNVFLNGNTVVVEKDVTPAKPAPAALGAPVLTINAGEELL